ncbi:D-serine ammonia-lyase [Chryseomicrobium palamuruense]|uniref:Probable D-serine dehydratase n=1 Tax=Chryseomicrobium palamuruense TaxID=682973 RepID=A0ABV8UVC0_9BACL
MNTADLIKQFPIIEQLQAHTETLWTNPHLEPTKAALEKAPLTYADVLDAEARLQRFAPYLQLAFPETEKSKGIIESVLDPIPRMQRELEAAYTVALPGRFFMKYDSHLPISGSIKARGGIYEVLKHAETLAIEAGRLHVQDDYAKLLSEEFRKFFSKYSIAVGSTGNLGLSIGIMSAKLGFHVTVHMSADAKAWKKELLREKGVEVIEYESDYSLAVERGREQAAADPFCHFIDDENSTDLFLGYAVAGLRLKQQLEQKGLPVDAEHPLYVYLPCGVGGGPGGVAFGLKHAFGDDVHCFFAEPTHSPCMLLGLVTDIHDAISVEDIGLDNKTEADGLAVGRASGFVGNVMKPMLAGAYTVSDETLFALLGKFHEMEGVFLEPSALAGLFGPVHLARAGQLENAKSATHLIWATGGGMVPAEMRSEYLAKAREARP